MPVRYPPAPIPHQYPGMDAIGPSALCLIGCFGEDGCGSGCTMEEGWKLLAMAPNIDWIEVSPCPEPVSRAHYVQELRPRGNAAGVLIPVVRTKRHPHNH